MTAALLPRLPAAAGSLGECVKDGNLCWRHRDLQRQAACRRGQRKREERAAFRLSRNQLCCPPSRCRAWLKLKPQPGRLRALDAPDCRREKLAELSRPCQPRGV